MEVELEEKIKKVLQRQEEILALQKRQSTGKIHLQEEAKQYLNFHEIIGKTPPMKDILAKLERVAPTLSTVFLRGENGTGKELIARTIHSNSPHRDGPFVKVNSAVTPVHLMESELFGCEKGSLTDAGKIKKGKFELATGGSIFLVEIGDLGLDLQVKLLQVLQDKEFVRLGGTKALKADARIIAATNRDIERAISRGDFREDLFCQLNTISITLPALSERKGDIRELASHFLNKFSSQMGKSIRGIDREAMETLDSYHWPGNIQELASVMERAVVLGEGETVSTNDLPKIIVPSQPAKL